MIDEEDDNGADYVTLVGDDSGLATNVTYPVTHDYTLLGFAKTGWRHFGAIFQPANRRRIE